MSHRVYSGLRQLHLHSMHLKDLHREDICYQNKKQIALPCIALHIKAIMNVMGYKRKAV